MTVSIVNKVAWPIGSKGSINPMLWKYGKLQEQIGSAFSDASLLVDFVQEKYHVNKVPFADILSLITFTRASGGTRINSEGVLELVGSNVPRLDYDPVTLAPRGWLIEEQRPNLVPYSGDPNNASWSNSGTPTLTQLSVDGLFTPCRVASSGTNWHRRQTAGVTLTAGTTYAFTVFYRPGSSGGIWCQLYGNASNNIAITGQASAPTLSGNPGFTMVSGPTVTQQANGVYKLTFAATPSTTLSVYAIGVGPSSIVVGQYIDLYGFQIEAGTKESSYIPTSGAAATRAADIATCTGTNFSSWFNATEGTFVLDVDVAATTTDSVQRLLLGLSNGLFANSMYVSRLNGSSGINFDVISAGVSQASFNRSGVTSGQPFKVAVAYALNNFALCLDGSAPGTDVSGALPIGMTGMTIGNGNWIGASNQMSGHIRRIAFFPRRLSNAELQVLTS